MFPSFSTSSSSQLSIFSGISSQGVDPSASANPATRIEATTARAFHVHAQTSGSENEKKIAAGSMESSQKKESKLRNGRIHEEVHGMLECALRISSISKQERYNSIQALLPLDPMIQYSPKDYNFLAKSHLLSAADSDLVNEILPALIHIVKANNILISLTSYRELVQIVNQNRHTAWDGDNGDRPVLKELIKSAIDAYPGHFWTMIEFALLDSDEIVVIKDLLSYSILSDSPVTEKLPILSNVLYEVVIFNGKEDASDLVSTLKEAGARYEIKDQFGLTGLDKLLLLGDHSEDINDLYIVDGFYPFIKEALLIVENSTLFLNLPALKGFFAEAITCCGKIQMCTENFDELFNEIDSFIATSQISSHTYGQFLRQMFALLKRRLLEHQGAWSHIKNFANLYYTYSTEMLREIQILEVPIIQADTMISHYNE